MDWTQVLTLIASNVALMAISIGSTIMLFLSARYESREDQLQIRNLIVAIQEEMKDFHGRLCIIEERNKSKEKKEK